VIVNLQSVFDGAFANVKIKSKVYKWSMRINERLNSGKQRVHISSGDIKWTLLLATPQRIQAVMSHSKATQLCTTRRLAQLWHCFGTTYPKGLMLNGGRDGSITYLAVKLQLCYSNCCLIKKMLWYIYWLFEI
jgi:hypothetical protein